MTVMGEKRILYLGVCFKVAGKHEVCASFGAEVTCRHLGKIMCIVKDNTLTFSLVVHALEGQTLYNVTRVSKDSIGIFNYSISRLCESSSTKHTGLAQSPGLAGYKESLPDYSPSP